MVNVKRLPAPIIESYEWQYDGACVDLDVERFFSPDSERGAPRRAREAAAKAVCAECPVVAQCLAHAIQVREPYGVWGGMTVEERAVIISGGSVERRRTGGAAA
ncbi:MAG: WhiB family transcriptional regulator [Aeromicrobium erythreum]